MNDDKQQKCTVHVLGLPDGVARADIIAHFGSVGRLQISSETGEPSVNVVPSSSDSTKSEAYITYENAAAANNAVELLNQRAVSQASFLLFL